MAEGPSLPDHGGSEPKEAVVSTTPNQPQYEAQFFTNIRNWGITRGDDGVLGGVVEGVGERIGLARVPARLLALVLIPFTAGLILAAYAAAWAILPDSDGHIIVQDFGRGTPNVPALIGITILGLIGFSMPSWGHPLGLGWVGVLISVIVGLGIVVGIIALIAWGVTKDENGQSRLIVEFRGSEAAKARAKEAGEAAREAGRNARDAAREAGRGAKEAGKKLAEGGKAAAKKAKAAAEEIRDAVAVQTAKPAADGAPDATSSALPPPPVPPRYLRPWVPGPSKAVRLLALGAAFLIGAIVWWLNREDLLNTTPIEAWFAAMVIVVGIGIVITGASGRRIGAFGFWATVLVVGWSIRIVVGPEIDKWLDSHDVLWDWDEGPRVVTVEDGTVECRSFDDSLPPSTTTIVAGDDETVTVTEDHTTIVVPRHSSVTLEGGWGHLDSTVSWTRQDGQGWVEYATCEVDGDSARFRTLGEHDADVTVILRVWNATIAIEER
jgi:phage shock protein PspC (stress-responsive transcriptional regulator)